MLEAMAEEYFRRDPADLKLDVEGKCPFNSTELKSLATKVLDELAYKSTVGQLDLPPAADHPSYTVCISHLKIHFRQVDTGPVPQSFTEFDSPARTDFETYIFYSLQELDVADRLFLRARLLHELFRAFRYLVVRYHTGKPPVPEYVLYVPLLQKFPCLPADIGYWGQSKMLGCVVLLLDGHYRPYSRWDNRWGAASRGWERIEKITMLVKGVTDTEESIEGRENKVEKIYRLDVCQWQDDHMQHMSFNFVGNMESFHRPNPLL